MSAPPGWHLQDDGRERFWDGQQWTEQFRSPSGSDPTAPPPAPSWATSDGTGTTSAEDEAHTPASDQTQALGVEQTQQLPTAPPAAHPGYAAPTPTPPTNPYATQQQAYPPAYAPAGVPQTGYGSANDPGPGWQPPQRSGGSGLLKGCLIAAVVGVIVLVGVVIAAIFFFNRAVDEVRDTLPTFPSGLPSEFPSELPSDFPTDGVGEKVDITVGEGFDLARGQVQDGWSLQGRGVAGFDAVEVKDMKVVLADGDVPLFFTLSFPAADGTTVETPCTASGAADQTVDVTCVPLLGDVSDAREGTATSAF